MSGWCGSSGAARHSSSRPRLAPAPPSPIPRRARQRLELDPRVSVWERSPSPPQKRHGRASEAHEVASASRRGEPHSRSKSSERTRKGEKRHRTRSHGHKKRGKHRRRPPSSSESDSSESSSTPSPRRKKPKRSNLPTHTSETATTAEGEFGPHPVVADTKGITYGPDMLRGEGAAMAEFVQAGQRIPRRGEVHAPEEIDAFEKSGFVMSGDRNRAMAAVRLRKESQVYVAEEKKALLQLAMEEKAVRESAIVAGLKNIVSEKQRRLASHVDAHTSKED